MSYLDVTTEELARAAQWATNFGKKHKINSAEDNGWKRVASKPSTTSNGLQAGAYQNSTKKTLIVVFKGTALASKSGPSDLRSDIAIATGTTPAQLHPAKKFLEEQIAYANLHNLDIVLSGHSLGGFLAQSLSHIEYKGEEYSFPFATFNAPGAKGNSAAGHPDSSTGFNLSIAKDKVGQEGTPLGPRHTIDAGGKNTHKISTFIGRKENQKKGKKAITGQLFTIKHNDKELSQYTIGDTNNLTLPSQLEINNITGINNGRIRHFQMMLQQYVTALLKSEVTEQNMQQLISLLFLNKFPDQDQYDASDLKFTFSYKENNDYYRVFTITKPTNGAVASQHAQELNPNLNLLIPRLNLANPETNKASPIYAIAQLDLLKLQVNLHKQKNKGNHTALNNYVQSLEEVKEKITTANIDTEPSKALADQAKMLRQTLFVLDDPNKNAADKVEKLESLKKHIDESENTLGQKIKRFGIAFVHHTIVPILNAFNYNKTKGVIQIDKTIEKRAIFLEQQTRETQLGLNATPLVKRLHAQLFTPAASFSNFFGQITQKQKILLETLDPQKLAGWQKELKSDPTVPSLTNTLSAAASNSPQYLMQQIIQLYVKYQYNAKQLSDIKSRAKIINNQISSIMKFLSANTKSQTSTLTFTDIKNNSDKLGRLERENQRLLDQIPEISLIEDSIASNLKSDIQIIQDSLKQNASTIEKTQKAFKKEFGKLFIGTVDKEAKRDRQERIHNDFNPSSAPSSDISSSGSQFFEAQQEQQQEQQPRLLAKDHDSDLEETPLLHTPRPSFNGSNQE